MKSKLSLMQLCRVVSAEREINYLSIIGIACPDCRCFVNQNTYFIIARDP